MTDTGKTQGNHDEFFAKCFEDLDIAQSFLQHYLPGEILAQIDLERIELEQGSYVDEELRRSYSDLAYTVPLRTQPLSTRDHRAFIYILVEHKSEAYEFTVFQLLRYMVRIWQRELESVTYRSGYKLSPVVPLILHHGRTAFHAPIDFGELVATFPGMEAFVPDYRCLLIDLTAATSEGLPESDARLHAILSVMQTVFGDEIDATVRDMAVRLAAYVDQPEIQHLLDVILNHVLQSAGKLTDDGFLTAIEPLGKTGGDMMSTLIEKWKEEGLKQGLEKGRQQGLEQGMERGRIEDRQNSIIEILCTRFGSVTESVRKSLQSISDLEELRQLTETAVTCESIDQFACRLK